MSRRGVPLVILVLSVILTIIGSPVAVFAQQDQQQKDPAQKEPAQKDPVKKDPAQKDPEKEDSEKKDPEKKDSEKKDEDKHRWGPIKWGPIDLKLGASIGRSVPLDEGEGPIVISSIIQSTFVRNGFGFALDLPFFSTDLLSSDGDGYPSPGQITVRPVAAGVSWTRKRGPLSFDVAGLAGYSFNGLDTPGRETRQWNRGRARLGPVRDVANGFAWEARAGVWYEFRPRWSVTAHMTYVWTRPELLMETGERRTWRADRVLWQVGLARTFRLNMPRPAISLPVGPK